MWSGAREWSEGGRGALINDVRRGQAVMGRKGSADSMKSGIMIGERPLALICLSYSNSFLDTDFCLDSGNIPQFLCIEPRTDEDAWTISALPNECVREGGRRRGQDM